MNWGKSIVVAFAIFAAFIGTLVVICTREDISLVSRNYYQEELVYELQIQRMNNANLLRNKPTMALSGDVLEVQFHEPGVLEHGNLKLFRPSDARLDKTFILETSLQVTQRFDLSSMPKGMYRAKMQWTRNGKEYFIENIITL